MRDIGRAFDEKVRKQKGGGRVLRRKTPYILYGLGACASITFLVENLFLCENFRMSGYFTAKAATVASTKKFFEEIFEKTLDAAAPRLL